VFDEVARKAGGARRAVTFADEKERRSPTLAVCEVETYELADGLNVALKSEILVRKLRLRGPAEARADRVYENKIGEVEPRLFVVNELEWRRRHLPVVEH